jgi:hypothetical protein
MSGLKNLKRNNMKQTAVEWLKKELEDCGSNSHLSLDWNTFDELCEQAKQMEKEQIMAAYSNNGWNDDDPRGDAEHYYKQVYEKLQNGTNLI